MSDVADRPSSEDAASLRATRVKKSRRAVIKIGSRTLASDRAVYERIAASVARRRQAGVEIVLVSSGAIALGLPAIGLHSRPKEMSRLQAAAAAGQSKLMRRYEEAFEAQSLEVAQVLLTHADLADRTRANNARAALDALLEAGVVPIINENDTVATDEIRFGDNDQLAALVSALTSADLLVLLSDVEGLLDRHGVRVAVVGDVASEALPLVGCAPIVESRKSVGSGGMASKLEAARRATLAGATVIIADARVADTLDRLFDGEDVGTLFVPRDDRIGARKHWILFTLRPRGTMIVDDGAVEALEARGGSLLAVGVLGVRGTFGAGDAVQIVDARGRELARGLSALAAIDVARVARKKGPEIEAILGRPIDAVVHRDDLVLLGSRR